MQIISKKIRSKGLYVFLMVAASVTGLIKTFMYAKFLGVHDFGIYSLMVLMSTYLIYLITIGIDSGFFRDGSIFFGEGEQEKLYRLSNHVVSFTIIIGLLFSLLIIVLLLFLGSYFNDFDRLYQFAGIFAFGLVLFNIVNTYQRVLHKLNEFSATLLARNLLSLILGILSAHYLGVLYVIISEVLSYFIVSVYVIIKYNLKIVIPKRSVIGSTIKTGLPFSGSNLLTNLSYNADQWVITFYLGTLYLGYYSFVMIFFTIGKAVMNIIGQAVAPKIISEYGRLKDIRTSIKTINGIIKYILFASIPILTVGYIILYFLIPIFYNEYAITIKLFPIIFIGILFYLLNLYPTILLALKKGKEQMIITGFNFVIIILACIIGYILKLDLTYYAILFMVSKVLAFLIYYIRIRKINSEKCAV